MLRKLWQLTKDAVSGWRADKASSMGAALAYYTLFSIVPLLLLLITLAGLFFGNDVARIEIIAELGALVGDESAQALDALLTAASDPQRGLAATLVSLATLLVGATTVLAELQADLDLIFKAPVRARPRGIVGLLRTRILSLGMILGLAFLLIVSLALSAALAALGRWWGPAFGEWLALLGLVNIASDFVVITAVIAVIYKLMPSIPLRWHDVWIGSAVTSLLLAAGKFLIGLYLGRSAVASAFGAAGSLIVLLIWVYYSTQIFLLGAEFTAVFARSVGSRARR